jgi:hypothetical protein
MQVAALFSVSQPTISAWEKQGFDRDWSDAAMREWVENKWQGRPSPPGVAAETMRTTPDATLSVAQRTAGLGLAETRTEKLRREIEHLELKIQRERGDLVAAQTVREQGIRIASIWCSELDAMVSDLPGQVAGLSEAELQPRLKTRIETLKTKIRHQMEAL